MDEDEVIDQQADPGIEAGQEQEQLPALDEGFEYQLDDDGEVEYDDDGEPIVIASVSDTNQEQEAGEGEQGNNDDAPPPVYLPTGEGVAAKRLKEALADPDLSALIDAAMEEKVERKLQTYGVTQAAFQAAAAQHPEVFAKYGGKIQMALALFPEQERHTRKSVDIATILATTEHKAGTPEFASELLKVAQSLAGKKASAAPKPAKPPIPAASRPPSPSSGARSAVTTTRENRVKSLMSEFNLDKEEAEAMMYDLGRKPLRR